ncbi:MAG: cytochrome c [Myxococcales bacterium]|nr:cytochrome c [Myxococcales bacterium]
MHHWTRRSAAALALALLALASSAPAAGCGAGDPATDVIGAEESIAFVIPGAADVSLTRESMASRVPGGPQLLTVYNKAYGRELQYRGYWLRDVMAAVGLDPDGVDELLFHCADGYAPRLAADQLDALKLFLAIEQVGGEAGPRWDNIAVGKETLSPGPYYVVGEQPGSYDAFPWPFQVFKIEGLRVDDTAARMYPQGAPAESAITRGYAQFREHCVVCHSVNLQGGTLGPELNVPRNITEYRDDATLRAFILNPSSYRARSRMPPFSQLTPEQLDALMAYLAFMKDHKQTPGR